MFMYIFVNVNCDVFPCASISTEVLETILGIVSYDRNPYNVKGHFWKLMMIYNHVKNVDWSLTDTSIEVAELKVQGL